LVVCRLIASIEAMQQRVKTRESGVSQGEYVVRVTKLNVILDRAGLEDFTIANENRSVTEVAQEMLVKAGWISDERSWKRTARSGKAVAGCEGCS
jgi:hypothetical protein